MHRNLWTIAIFSFLVIGAPPADASASLCLELFSFKLSDANLNEYPLLIRDWEKLPRRGDNVSLISIKTTLGMVTVPTRVAADLRNTAQNVVSKEEISAFVRGILDGQMVARAANPGFFEWIQRGYKMALTATLSNYATMSGDPITGLFLSQPGPGRSIENDIFRWLPLLEAINSDSNYFHARRAANTAARAAGEVSPLTFRIDRHSWGDVPHDMHPFLVNDEVMWLYRILMREPLIRSLLIDRKILSGLSNSQANEIVFFVSAFPELVDFATDIERLGFKFNSYTLTDGLFTEGRRVHIDSSLPVVLNGALSLQKRFAIDSEVLYGGEITIGQEHYQLLSPRQQEQVKQMLNEKWGEFLASYPNYARSRLTIKEDDGWVIRIQSSRAQGLITTLFFMRLVQ